MKTQPEDDRDPKEIEREEVDAYLEELGNFGVDAGTDTKAREIE